MVQFYPYEGFPPLTEECEKVLIPDDVKNDLVKFIESDIAEINDNWQKDDKDELEARIRNMKTEQGRAEIEAEFYKRFEAADANCNNRLSIEEWLEFTEGYKVGREQRREKFIEKDDD